MNDLRNDRRKEKNVEKYRKIEIFIGIQLAKKKKETTLNSKFTNEEF